MNYKSEYIEKFYDKYLLQLRDRLISSQKLFFNEKREILSKDLVKEFKTVLSKAVELQKCNKKGKIMYIVLSILRSGVYTQSCLCRIDVYDERFYADDKECYIEVDFPWIRSDLSELEKNIISEMKNSSIKLPDYMIEKIVLNEVLNFSNILYYLLRYSIEEFEKLEELQGLSKYDCLDIHIGEYYDTTKSTYIYDTRVLNSMEVRKELESKSTHNYVSIKNLDLKAGTYANKDLCLSDFSGCDFEGSSFKNSNLAGTSWRNCNLKNVDFSGSNLSEADFRGALVENTIFNDTILNDVFW
ncbi:MAG: pentapeptide repeat-containing protein [Defluviitaleaceae bacterium]|nr:pentapeptide repeat-containing protein [Defluviitaleaceae bacterium]